MDLAVSTVAAPAQGGVPRYASDLRPAADAAALSRDPRPDMPSALPAPATTHAAPPGPAADSDGDRSADRKPLRQPDRVLKPWGVAMLPDSAQHRREAAAARRERDADPRPSSLSESREPSRAAPQSVTEALTRRSAPADDHRQIDQDADRARDGRRAALPPPDRDGDARQAARALADRQADNRREDRDQDRDHAARDAPGRDRASARAERRSSPD